MTRREKLAEWQEHGHVWSYQCGHPDCGWEETEIHLLGFTFGLRWSACAWQRHNYQVYWFLKDQLGILLVNEDLVWRTIHNRNRNSISVKRDGAERINDLHALLRDNRATTGWHYRHVMYSLRDIAPLFRPHMTRRCVECGRKARYTVYRWSWFGHPDVPFYLRLADGKWIPYGVRNEKHLWEQDDVCSASCWLKHKYLEVLAYKREERDRKRLEKEMVWIRKAKVQLKTVRRFLREEQRPWTLPDPSLSPSPASEPAPISRT